MSVTWTWSGLEELKAALRELPAELGGEASHLVEARGNRAAYTIKAGYPSRSGDLRDKLEVEHTHDAFGARAVVTNTSKHAKPFELGSQSIRLTTKGASRGTMPPNPLFSQTMRRERRALNGDLKDLLVRKGLLVLGDA